MSMYNDFSGLYKRIFWWKLIWFAFSFIGFLFIILSGEEWFTMLAWGLLIWYPIVWFIVWVVWIMDRHPIFSKFRLYIWRWIFIWGFLNLVLVLMAYYNLHNMIEVFTGYDFWRSLMFLFFVSEWMFIWGLIDYVCTNMFGEGEKILKK